MAQDPYEIAAIAGGNVKVAFYYNDIIEGHYTSRDDTRRGHGHPTNEQLLNAYVVTEIRRYKKPQGAEHEYIVARVVYRNPIAPTGLARLGPRDRVFFVQVERGGGNPNQPVQSSKGISSSGGAKARDEKSSSNALTFDSKIPVSASSSYPLAQLFKALDANDKVSQLSSWPAGVVDLTKMSAEQKKQKTDALVAAAQKPENKDKVQPDMLLKKQKLRKEGEVCTLADLATLAFVIHNSDKKYKLLSRQCYWFADTLMQVLTAQYARSPTATPAPAPPAQAPSSSQPQAIHVDAETHMTVGPEDEIVPAGTDITTTAATWAGPDPDAIEQAPATDPNLDSDSEEPSGSQPAQQPAVGRSMGDEVSGQWKFLNVQKTKTEMVTNTTAAFTAKKQELHAKVCSFLIVIIS